MREHRYEEISLVEDKSNLLDLSIKTLCANSHGSMCITKDIKDVLEWKSNWNGSGKNANKSDMSITLIYTRPLNNKNKVSELLDINSELTVIPLLLLVGPTKDMNSINNQLGGAYPCCKQSVDLQKIIKKARKMPVYWAVIRTMSRALQCES